ncbi:multiple epidermal growth factor-like domains protein 10 isoform X2 [Gigantopelta aegis]|uniref:multiple epidermal growth factor-like domains protein 10 isoform X2 n=1 Tax=Gigantopelta aegis TaxID=1735272 RepID=UPI001B887CD6|nr:multiple epidermal growth factor-like domains protein 10 isoform X2 [Gigantopelta aegis]
MSPQWTYFMFRLCYLILQSRHTFADFVNVAIDKPAYQSSYADVYRASTAVDGITIQQGNNFMHTSIRRPYTWWEVDLGQVSFIRDVVIYFRVNFTLRRNGVKVYTNTQERTSNNGHLCGTVTGRPDGSDIPDVVNITCDVNARYVTIYQDTDNGGSTALDFLEVEVYSCEENVTYGTHCSKLCSDRNCADSPAPCHLQTGSCSGGCRAGWSGTDCIDECQKGVSYGVGCALKCTDRYCLKTSSCDTKDGMCIGGCLPGWILSDCSEVCSNGLYGPRCSRSCVDRHCNGYSRCDHTDGKCETVCEVGWKGVDCAECAVGNYGADCQKLCQNRKCQGDQQQCDPEAGQCFGGCLKGWSGTACTIFSPQTASDSTTVVSSAVMGVLSVIVIIQSIVIIRYILIVRKVRASSGPSVSFSNKPNTRITTTTSSVYEVVDGDTNVRSPPVERVVNTQNGQANGSQHDYVNSSHPVERSKENVNHYDRLDVDVIGEGSPYSKIEV